jgi:hypothetical protein
MLILADNDVGGAVAVLRRLLETGERAEFSALIGVEFIDFESLGLPRDAPDRTVWQVCQAAGAVLITGNRASGAASLDQAIRELSGAASLPVLTLADPKRLLRDPAYAETAAVRLLDFLERIDSLRGIGRLFIP